MKILGIHDGHNAAAALVEDGVIIAAVQEERLSRIKNHDAFPARACQRVLQLAGVSANDVDGIALNGWHQPRHRDRQQLMTALREAGTLNLRTTLRQWARGTFVGNGYRRHRRSERLQEAHAAGLSRRKIQFIDHHQAHAVAAYWGAPFAPEPTLALTCDGAGDGLAATVSVGQGGYLNRQCAVPEEHSIAMVYLTVTQLLGMVPNEHEYKLMGMAPYARPETLEACQNVFDSLFEFDGGGQPTWRRRSGVPHAFCLYGYLRDRLEGFRFDVICGALQRWFEQWLCEWVTRAIRSTGVRRVALSGGAFMNVKANKAIAEQPEVEALYIFPSCGDESNAVGAALAAEMENSPASIARPCHVRTVYWGEAFGDNAVMEAVQEELDPDKGQYLVHWPDNIIETTAAKLAEGHIVARFDGQAEFGARALGARSILAHPAHPEQVRRLNAAIKNRDFWMPFAGAILAEKADRYLSNPRGLDSPCMMLAFDTTDRRSDIQAAIHPWDNTMRPQILGPDDNPEFRALIETFEQHTGVGALLNTSLNLHGMPMVYSPRDALQVLKQSGLRWLAIGPVLIEKRG